MSKKTAVKSALKTANKLASKLPDPVISSLAIRYGYQGIFALRPMDELQACAKRFADVELEASQRVAFYTIIGMLQNRMAYDRARSDYQLNVTGVI